MKGKALEKTLASVAKWESKYARYRDSDETPEEWNESQTKAPLTNTKVRQLNIQE
jgi:hypothetical protein